MANYVKKYDKHKGKNKKRYPSKSNNRRHQSNQGIALGNFYNGNLAHSMNFGGKDHELSGYVKREVFVKDRYGNIQKAKETQFFNSGKRIGRVSIGDDDSESGF